MLRYSLAAIIILLSTLLFESCSPKQHVNPILSGTISGLENNYILLSKVEDIQTKKTTFIDTLFLNKNNDFTYSKVLKTGIYNLKFNTKQTVQIALNKGTHLKISGTDLEHLTFVGSTDTNLLLAYEQFRKASLQRLVYAVRNEIKELKKQGASTEKISELRSLEIENYKKHLDELTQFISTKMGTSIAILPTSIRWNTENIDSYKTIVHTFTETHPNLDITQKLKTRVSLLEKTAVGSTIISIEMPSKNGEIISLNRIKKTYTLIDFWASWCPPCRTESKLLNELYSNFNSIGFEIYGISLDSKQQRWLDALQKDKRVWPNVSTLEGFNSPIAQEFGITALPTNLIIDANGIIIASNLHGNHLKEFIENLFP